MELSDITLGRKDKKFSGRVVSVVGVRDGVFRVALEDDDLTKITPTIKTLEIRAHLKPKIGSYQTYRGKQVQTDPYLRF